MPEVLCPWILCKYNTSSQVENCGRCLHTKIHLKSFEIEINGEYQECVECNNYEEE